MLYAPGIPQRSPSSRKEKLSNDVESNNQRAANRTARIGDKVTETSQREVPWRQ